MSCEVIRLHVTHAVLLYTDHPFLENEKSECKNMNSPMARRAVD
jgi:hypothetical protein